MARTFAIGDIHGCFDAMMELVDWVNPSTKDKLIFLGDYVNRGPDTNKVLDWLVRQSATRDLVCLRGNHEIMKLESSGQRLDGSHRRFIEGLASYHETAHHIFVHACVYGDMPMDQQPDYILHWENFSSMTRPESGKKVVCGHSAQRSGEPLQNDFAVCIDTNCCRGGWLTCLDVDTGRYFQTNQECRRRDGWLDNWVN